MQIVGGPPKWLAKSMPLLHRLKQHATGDRIELN